MKKYKFTNKETGKQFIVTWNKETEPTEDDFSAMKSSISQPEKSYGSKVLEDVKQTANAMLNPVAVAKGGYGLGQRLAEGVEQAWKPSVTGGRDISKLAELGSEMAKPYLHPKESLKEGKIASTALAWGAPAMALKGGISSLMGKPGKMPIVPKKTVPVSELIAGKLQKSTVEDVAQNPFVQKGMSMFAGEDLNDVVNSAAKSTMDTFDKISDIQSSIYKKYGVTDDLVISPENINTALKNIKPVIDKFSKNALGENKIIAKNAQGMINDIVLKSKTEPITFGQLKSITRQVYDLADTNVTEMDRFTEAGRMYNDIGKELTIAKKSSFPIKEAGDKYVKLMEAERILRDTMRLNKVLGEDTLPLKIMRRYKDAQHGQFKQKLNKVNDIIKENSDIIKENPDTAHLINEHGNADFVDKIKLTQALHDTTTARAITPSGASRWLPIAAISKLTKVSDPLVQMNMLKKGIEKGIINPQAVSREIPVPNSIIGGRTISKINALSEIINKPEWMKNYFNKTNPLQIANIVNLSRGSK